VATEFEVNIDAILASADLIGTMGSRLGTIERELKSIAKIALVETFEEAVIDADSYDGFPPEFQDHTMRVIRNFESYYVIYDGYSVFVSVDFDDLGTQEELRRAFHQGARLADKSILWGPYEGQPLASGNPQQSHDFWEAVRYGNPTWFNEKTKKDIPMDKLVKHPWDEVVNKYVEIWGDKCPEWLFIQWGQEEWEPIVPQYDIIGEFETKFFTLCEELLTTFVEAQIRQAEAYETIGAKVGFTSKGQPRLLSGSESFINPATGKTISPGRFAPKL